MTAAMKVLTIPEIRDRLHQIAHTLRRTNPKVAYEIDALADETRRRYGGDYAELDRENGGGV